MIVHESVFEKFEQESDPIHDLGIGIFTEHDFESIDEMHKFIAKFIEHIIGVELPKVFIMVTPERNHSCMKTKYYDKIADFIDKYVTIQGKEVESNSVLNMIKLANFLKRGIRISSSEEIRGNEKILSEKFIEKSDPVHDLNIGEKKFIEQKLEKLVTIIHEKTPRYFWVTNILFRENKDLEFVLQVQHSAKHLHLDIIYTALRDSGVKYYIEYPAKIEKMHTYTTNLIWKVREEMKDIIRDINHIRYIIVDNKPVIEVYFKNTKLVKESINEKFKEEKSDPIRDMRIGMLHEIIEWYQSYVSNSPRYTKIIDYNDIVYRAILENKFQYANFLLDVKLADINANDSKLLRIAAFTEDENLLNFVLKKGADLDAAIENAIKHDEPVTLYNLRKIKEKLHKDL